MGFYRRSLDTFGQLYVAEKWRDGVRTFEAWNSFRSATIGEGETREAAIRNLTAIKIAERKDN